MSSFFNRYSYVDRAIEEIKKYISIEAASKHFMVVFTLVELYNQKHQYLKEARNFMWHYERYHDLLTLLNNIFKDIFK